MANKDHKTFGNSNAKRNEKSVIPLQMLIVCEGEKTEPGYFKWYEEKFKYQRIHTFKVKVKGEGKNTITLVEAAVLLASQNCIYDEVWCVFDRDSFGEVGNEKRNDFQRALNLIEELNNEPTSRKKKCPQYHSAVSVEAFELWFLLHFHYVETCLSRTLYKEKIQNYLKQHDSDRFKDYSYKKNDTQLFDFFHTEPGLKKKAINNAEKLYEKWQEHPEYSYTTVHLLVDRLDTLLAAD